LNHKTIFYLARHGQTEWNVEQRIQGQLDSPLTTSGEDQARSLAAQCVDLNISAILTSPLGRAVKTAEICAERLSLIPTLVEGFEERHFGTWQGLLVSEVKAHCDYAEITSQITDCKPQSGESAKQALSRFERALSKALQTANQKVTLVILHGELLRCFLTQFVQPAQTAPLGKKPSNTGYDYPNGQLIPLSYDQHTGTYSYL
jgi:broad specificity phosphatase PhoE